MSNKGLTDIQKNMLLKLLESNIAEGFETSFLESIKKCYDNNWSISIAQHATLTDLYDKKILGNTEEKTEFKFGLITIMKNENNKMWKLWIEDREIDEQFTRKDALVISNFLNEHLPGICMDMKMETEILDRFINQMDQDVDSDGDAGDEPDPF